MAKHAPARRRPRKARPGTKGLSPAECRVERPQGSAAEVAGVIEKAGGCVVGLYKARRLSRAARRHYGS
jgi:hypothetical protein